jgi:hypothetical protein
LKMWATCSCKENVGNLRFDTLETGPVNSAWRNVPRRHIAKTKLDIRERKFAHTTAPHLLIGLMTLRGWRTRKAKNASNWRLAKSPAVKKRGADGGSCVPGIFCKLKLHVTCDF